MLKRKTNAKSKNVPAPTKTPLHKLKAKATGGFRSSLEAYAHKRLTEAGLQFCYECEKVVLLPSFSFPSYERRGKKSKELVRHERILPMTYTPDFVGMDREHPWYMETKGMRTPDFDIKWKLFKSKLLHTSPGALLLLPRNYSEVEKALVIINEYVERT